jgi:hypothetical protein
MNRTETREPICAVIAVGIVALLLGAHVGAQDAATPAKTAQNIAAPAQPPQDGVTPTKILDDTAAAYKALDTLKSEGTIVSDMEVDGKKVATESTFSLLLKKPNLYLITWNRKMAGMQMGGAVWSDGTQAYLSMDIGAAAVGKSYSKMKNDDMALASATGISDGAAFTVPSLFLPVFKDQPPLAAKMQGARREPDEKVGDEDCYVVSGATAVSKKETFWVSKSKHLIVRFARSMESPAGGREMPETTDAQIEESLTAMGQEVTEASKKRVKEMIASAAESMKTTEMKGTSTETHTHIASPELTAKDFQYVPEGATLRDSPFGFGAGQPEPAAQAASAGVGGGGGAVGAAGVGIPAPGNAAGGAAAGAVENPSAVGPAGYVLDRAAFAAQLAATHDDRERLAILAKRWDQVVFAVAFCNVAEEMPFSSAMMQQKDGFLL